MFSGFISRHLFAACYAVFLVLPLHYSCCARNLNHRHHRCSPSSCGNIRNISNPFRLKTDPKICGNKKYELACENNRPVVYSDNKMAAKYYVQAINYNNLTIRLADADVEKDNCSSIPHHSLSSYYDYYYYIGPERQYRLYYYDVIGRLIFVTCANPVSSSPRYMDTSSCNGNGTYNNNNNSMSSPSHSNAYSYVIVPYYNHPLRFEDLMDSCHTDVMIPVMLLAENLTNLSYKQVHDSMIYGFELSWDHGSIYPADLLLLPAVYFVLVRVALFICGIPCIITLLIYKWRRRHLSMYNMIEEFLQSHDNHLIVEAVAFMALRV